jgi:hypothetical protein
MDVLVSCGQEGQKSCSPQAEHFPPDVANEGGFAALHVGKLVWPRSKVPILQGERFLNRLFLLLTRLQDPWARTRQNKANVRLFPQFPLPPPPGVQSDGALESDAAEGSEDPTAKLARLK